MEWITSISRTVEYIENNLLDEKCADKALKQTFYSPMLFNKGFQILTGHTVSSYIRGRRLYLAAIELKETDIKIIDLALKYGFETPESFTKAFSRFHGSSPSQVRAGAAIQTFLPLRINLSMQGADQIKCKIMEKSAITIVGYIKEFDAENSKEMIPAFWSQVIDKNVGDFNYALCIDDLGRTKFRYLIGREYKGEDIIEGMEIFTLPSREWAVFECDGENPKAIQALDDRIWKEWLPGNSHYELHGNINVEYYATVNHSEIWIPIKKAK